MNKLLIICGPTATGKTKLALELARMFNGEIVSADSRQVYKGMDIGTGKDLPLRVNLKRQMSKLKAGDDRLRICFYEIRGIRVWLYDVVEPSYKFNVADYVKCASLVIKDIWKREKLPIMVGGTGFYIKAVVEGIKTLGVKPNWKLRKKLEEGSVSELQERLSGLCPERSQRMNESDWHNPRRLIRAIELSMNKEQSTVNTKRILFDDLLMIGLTAENKLLYQRIDKRVDERVQAGAEEEINRLWRRGYNFKNSVLGTTIGYREWQGIKGKEKMPKEEIIKRWKFDEHGYARRQMTWFRTQNVHWFNVAESGYKVKMVDLIKQWYHRN